MDIDSQRVGGGAAALNRPPKLGERKCEYVAGAEYIVESIIPH